MRNLRRPLGLVPLIVLAACQAADQPIAGAADDPGEIPEYSIEQFLASTNVFGSSFSPTGDKILVSGDETGIYNAYAIPIDGSPSVQLTHSADDAVRVAGYFPTDERFLYLSDQGGNELHHLFVRSGWNVTETIAVICALAVFGSAVGLIGHGFEVSEFNMAVGYIVVGTLYYFTIESAWRRKSFLGRKIPDTREGD